MCAKKTKITNLFNNLSPPRPPGAILESITYVYVCFDLSVNVHVMLLTQNVTMFLDLDRGRTLAVYGRDRKLPKFIKNILICVPKMEEGLTGLERHVGE